MKHPFYNYAKAMVQVTREWRMEQKDIQNLVHKKLESVLISSFRSVPYFRNAMEAAGYNPEKHYSGIQDLRYLPVNTKEERKRSKDDFLMEGIDLDQCFCTHTSGSTGIPLQIYRTPYERAVQIAKWMRVLFLNGYHPGYKTMSLSSPRSVGLKPSLIQKMGLFRRKIIDFLLLPEDLADALLEYKPHLLYGNRQQLDFIALELQRRNIKLNTLKLLVETGAIIRYNHRKFHQEQFGTPLVESFGSEEAGIIAHETPYSSGLRICEDTTIIEFLDDRGEPVGPGQSGRVVVTDLTNHLNPFIRYDHGDFATYDYMIQPDGTTRKVVRKILGRECDYVVLPDGTHRLYYDFYDIVSRYEHIHQCRIIQKTTRMIHLEIVAETSYLDHIAPDLLNRVKKAFPDEMTFKIIQKDKINLDPNGKIRMFITEVASKPDLTPNMHRPG